MVATGIDDPATIQILVRPAEGWTKYTAAYAVLDGIGQLSFTFNGRAMLLIREYAGEWLVDTDRIALCGFSARAHNAAMFATKWHTPLVADALGGPAELYRPAALTSICASLFGRYDFNLAFNVVFPITCIFRATAAVIMGALLGASGGDFRVPYVIFIIGSLVAFFLFMLIRYQPKETGVLPEEIAD